MREAGGFAPPEPQKLPIFRGMLGYERGYPTLPAQTRRSPREERQAGEGERGLPHSMALEGTPGETGKEQLPKGADEEAFRSMLGAFSPWCSSDTWHVLFRLEFLCLESVWVNSWHKSADVAQMHRLCLMEFRRAALPAAERIS